MPENEEIHAYEFQKKTLLFQDFLPIFSEKARQKRK